MLQNIFKYTMNYLKQSLFLYFCFAYFLLKTKILDAVTSEPWVLRPGPISTFFREDIWQHFLMFINLPWFPLSCLLQVMALEMTL